MRFRVSGGSLKRVFEAPKRSCGVQKEELVQGKERRKRRQSHAEEALNTT